MNEVEIYVDEQFDKNFVCTGCLFVSVDKKEVLVKTLSNMRCLDTVNKDWYWNFNECPRKRVCNKYWHKLNNVEIHYTELGRASNPFKQISKNRIKRGSVYISSNYY